MIFRKAADQSAAFSVLDGELPGHRSASESAGKASVTSGGNSIACLAWPVDGDAATKQKGRVHRPGSTGRVGVAVFDCSFRCNARVANRCLRALRLRRGNVFNGKSRLAASARKQSSSTYWSSKSIAFL